MIRDEVPDPQDSGNDEIKRRGGLVLRTLPILLIPLFVGLITALLLRLAGNVAPPPPHPPTSNGFIIRPLVPIVALIIFFTALIVLVRLRRPTISALVLIGVWTVFTTLSALRSGVDTIFPALLVLPICAAGLLIDGVASISLAVLATILVLSLAWLEIRGLVVPQLPPPELLSLLPFIAASFWIGIFWSVAALTFLLAGGLQRALRQSRAQAKELRDFSDQLEARVAQQTAQLLAQAQEVATQEERARLAREIHDTLAQGLTGIVLQLGAAQRALAHAPDEAPEHMNLAQRMAREALQEARRSVWNLRPGMLARDDLGAALRGLASRPLSTAGATVQFVQRGTPWPLPADVESTLLRVAQEALANADRHAGAKLVEILLCYQPEAVQLQISDDGVGFSSAVLKRQSSVPGPEGGFGLSGMRERLAALGGTLELHNDEGASVCALIPRKNGEG